MHTFLLFCLNDQHCILWLQVKQKTCSFKSKTANSLISGFSNWDFESVLHHNVIKATNPYHMFKMLNFYFLLIAFSYQMMTQLSLHSQVSESNREQTSRNDSHSIGRNLIPSKVIHKVSLFLCHVLYPFLNEYIFKVGFKNNSMCMLTCFNHVQLYANC